MALVKCRECGGTVSSFAKICPHCGHEMEDVEIASEVTNQQESQPEMTYQPIDTPSYNPRVRRDPETAPQPSQQLPQMEISSGSLGKVLMCLLSVICIILLGVFVGKIKGHENISKDFVLFLTGYVFSFVGLYYFIRMVVSNNGVQQFLGFIIGFASVFIEVVLLSHTDQSISDDLSKALDILLLICLISVMWFAGTKNDWSKIFFLIAGTLLIAGFSMIPDSTPGSTEMIVFAVFGGIGLFAMLVGWLVEMTLKGNNSTTRLIAIIEVALILTTVIIGAITLKTILDSGADVTERYNKIKLTMIVLMISGASSAVLSLFLPRKRFLFFVSVLFLASAMLLTLGNYCVFKEEAIRYSSYYTYYDYYIAPAKVHNELVEHADNLIYAGMFFIPISILMSYVADLTKGITSRISFKMS